jgi:hypothetical protein
MKIGDIVKIKNPSFNFQKTLKYRITKVNKTTVHCRVVEFDKISKTFKDVHYEKDYTNIPFKLIEPI